MSSIVIPHNALGMPGYLFPETVPADHPVATATFCHPHLPISNFCQTPGQVFRLGVDFVLPLSQEEQEKQEEQEEEPTPKYIRRGRTRRLKFGT